MTHKINKCNLQKKLYKHLRFIQNLQLTLSQLLTSDFYRHIYIDLMTYDFYALQLILQYLLTLTLDIYISHTYLVLFTHDS